MGSCCSNDTVARSPNDARRVPARRRTRGAEDVSIMDLGARSDRNESREPALNQLSDGRVQCRRCRRISATAEEFMSNHEESCPVLFELNLLALLIHLQQQQQPPPEPIDLEPYSSRFPYSGVCLPDEGGQEVNKCPVCLEPYEFAEDVRLLPCFHQFHTVCVDHWFEAHNTCPVCRLDPRRMVDGDGGGIGEEDV